MADALKTHATKGDYDAISDGDAFASRLTKDLQEVSHDKHLNVNFSPFKMPPRTEPTPEEKARFHRQMEHNNCAFDKVEILPNNIGYVKFDACLGRWQGK
jgi:retinol-binding protein 3